VELVAALEQSLALPEATRADIEQLCASAREHGLHGVCVSGSRVELAFALLEDTSLKVTALIGYPLGTADSDVKRFETETAVDHGAQEIEVVLNAGRLKDGDHRYVLREMRDIAEAADERPVKVVLEGSLLSAEERRIVCELALDSGVHAICTGTGLRAAATVEDVRELRAAVGEKFGVKASGGIIDAATALALLEAGATRLGVADAGKVLSTLQ